MRNLLLLSLAAAALAAAQTNHLGDIRQLTHGGQNAEAYWSPDGKRLIFQSTRPPYGCDQIFIMNADGSDQHLVSTGKGRTTCGYFLADNKHIVYASTHLAADACPTTPTAARAMSGASSRGTTSSSPTDRGKIEKRLTDAPGYDAEAHGQLEDRRHRLSRPSLPATWISGRCGPTAPARSSSPASWVTTAVRCSRATARSWCGAPTIPRRPRKLTRYKALAGGQRHGAHEDGDHGRRTRTAATRAPSPTSAAPVSPPRSRRTASASCSRPTSRNATAANSNCT